MFFIIDILTFTLTANNVITVLAYFLHFPLIYLYTHVFKWGFKAAKQTTTINFTYTMFLHVFKPHFTTCVVYTLITIAAATVIVIV